MRTERLSTLDEFGGRRFVIPAEVQGKWRKRRERVYYALMLVFLILPWLTINDLQAVRLDIPGRRFEIFGMLFLAHDAPLLFPAFILVVMAIAFVTAVWGRVWCGWACPQTVFVEGLYRRVEIFFEGTYIERRRLHASGFSPERVRKSGLKWLAFFALSSLISHSFIAYFTGSRELVAMIGGDPTANWTYFLLVSSMTALLLFNFGWFREQFCAIMCPYGRIQSVLMDDRSVTITYDEKRGEPRKGSLAATAAGAVAAARGACVSCRRCVEVCPAKIDIRDGLQMECIACTACVDACDEIMVKTKQPTGLIRYSTKNGEPAKLWTARTLGYLAVAVIAISSLAYNISRHTSFSLSVLRATDVPYQVMPNGEILNHFRAHSLNQSRTELELVFSLSPESIARGARLTQALPRVAVPPGKDADTHLFLTFPKSMLDRTGEATYTLRIVDARSGDAHTREARVVGPIPE